MGIAEALDVITNVDRIPFMTPTNDLLQALSIVASKQIRVVVQRTETRIFTSV